MGRFAARVPAEIKELVLKTVDEAVAAGFAQTWATAPLGGGLMTGCTVGGPDAATSATLESTGPRAGTRSTPCSLTRSRCILQIAEQWGPVDRSHRKLAHRGSYENLVWVSPSTFLRILDAHDLKLPEGPPPSRSTQDAVAGLAGMGTEPHLDLGCHPLRANAKRAVFAIMDMVSRKWIATLVSPEESSTQVQVVFRRRPRTPRDLVESVDRRTTRPGRRRSGPPDPAGRVRQRTPDDLG